MEKNENEKDDFFSKKYSPPDSPKQFIKSTLFNSNKKNNKINNHSNKILFNRRSLTPNIGNFLLNQIGYIKKDTKIGSKKPYIEDDEKEIKTYRKFSSPNAKDLVNRMFLNSNNLNNNFESDNKTNIINDMPEKNCTEDKYSKIRRKYSVNIKKKKRAFLNKKNNLDKLLDNNILENKYKSNKNLETNNMNFDQRASKQKRPSLSFGDVEEDDNEELSNDNDNNNDSSYISKIESKHVSMYDIDEELKELKEIGNNLKSPIYNPINKGNNRLISSFSINNNDNNENENDNNDIYKQQSILFHLKNKVSKDNEMNKLNHNPIVFDDKLELSFHEDLNKKSIIISNQELQNIICFDNDRNKIKKLKFLDDDKMNVTWIEKLKNERYFLCYKNDVEIIKKLDLDINFDIAKLENLRKERFNLNSDFNDLDINYNSGRNSLKVNNNHKYIINTNVKNDKNNDYQKTKNKTAKKKEVSFLKSKEIKNTNNNYNLNTTKTNSDNNLKNNYLFNNENELNQLIKEKINILNHKNVQNFPKIQYLTTLTNKNIEDNNINLTFMNTSLNSQREQYFNYNSLLMSHENNIFCLGRKMPNSNHNNITYNKFFNGNNITMNNFYNNYKLNDSNNNINFITDNNNEKDLVFNNDKNVYNRNNNVIAAIKKKLALKLQEEIKKNKDIDNINKIEKNQIINDGRYYKCSSQENLNTQNYLKRKNQNKSCDMNRYKGVSSNKNIKLSSAIKHRTNSQKSYNLDVYEENSNDDELYYNLYNENNTNYQTNSINSYLTLNPIKEQSYISKNKKNNLEAKSKSKNLNSKNIKKIISSEKQLLNKKNNNNLKTKSKIVFNEHKQNVTKSNYPINKINVKDKNINKNTDKAPIKKKELINKNNNITDKDKSQNKNHNNKNNTIKEKNKINNINHSSYYNLNNKTKYNNSTIKSNNDNNITNNIVNDSKNISTYNKCSSGEIIYKKAHKNTNSNVSEKNRVLKNKKIDFRNDRVKDDGHSLILSKKNNNTKTNIDLKDYNSSLNNIELKNKSKNKNYTKSKKNINTTEVKKNIINKSKIHNK